VSNDAAIFRLHLAALQPQMDALHARLNAVLDDCRPANWSAVSVLVGMLCEHIAMASPEVRSELRACIVEALNGD
jgi:hypothetical protein